MYANVAAMKLEPHAIADSVAYAKACATPAHAGPAEPKASEAAADIHAQACAHVFEQLSNQAFELSDTMLTR